MVMMKTMPYNKNITAAAAFNNNNNCLERKLLKTTVLLVFFSFSTYCFYCFRMLHRTLERAIQHTTHNTTQYNAAQKKCEKNRKRKP